MDAYTLGYNDFTQGKTAETGPFRYRAEDDGELKAWLEGWEAGRLAAKPVEVVEPAPQVESLDSAPEVSVVSEDTILTDETIAELISELPEVPELSELVHAEKRRKRDKG